MDLSFGLDMGFWYSMAVVVVATVIYNIVFWSFKPREKPAEGEEDVERGFFGNAKNRK